jgi:hypothetical protein
MPARERFGVVHASLLKALIASLWVGCSAASASDEEWRFRVLLDAKEIGEHRFTSSTSGAIRKIESNAAFTVEILGIPVYRYRHSASETWRGACLAQLAAQTDDNGVITRLDARGGQDGSLELSVGNETRGVPRCTMSFAYWNPAFLQQTRLLNVQTGALEQVQVRSMGEGTLEAQGRIVAARRWRITGAGAPLDVWYSAEGEWLGLDASVAGGRKLSYRLR